MQYDYLMNTWNTCSNVKASPLKGMQYSIKKQLFCDFSEKKQMWSLVYRMDGELSKQYDVTDSVNFTK